MSKARPDQLGEMLAFISVAEARSFTVAAERLGLTSSAVSKAVTRLETRLKAKLLQRTTRIVRLTEVGSAYLARANAIVESIETLEQDTQSSRDVPRGTLRVSAPLLLGHARVLPAVLAFQKQYADIRVELEMTDRVVDIIDERYDVAIRMTATPPLALVARRLADDRRVFCASPGYLRARGVPKTPADLDDHDGILFARSDILIPWRLLSKSDAPRVVTYQPRGRLQLSSVIAVRDAAMAGLGIADLPQYYVDADIRAKRLVPLLSRFAANDRGIWAVYPPSRFMPKKVLLFVDFLRGRL